MTKKDAQDALRQGKKITHRFFLDTEFIQMKDGKLHGEDGMEMPDFWKYREESRWDNGWSVFGQPPEEQTEINPFSLELSEEAQAMLKIKRETLEKIGASMMLPTSVIIITSDADLLKPPLDGIIDEMWFIKAKPEADAEADERRFDRSRDAVDFENSFLED